MPLTLGRVRVTDDIEPNGAVENIGDSEPNCAVECVRVTLNPTVPSTLG